MNYQQCCPHCSNGNLLVRLVEHAMGLACPMCSRVYRIARAAQSLPGITPQGVSFLQAVATFAFGVGIAALLRRLF